MIAHKEKRKQLLDFLIIRWKLIIKPAAGEKIYAAAFVFTIENNLPEPKKPDIIIPQACLQIKIIKQHIVKILPEAHFIEYDYEPPIPLNPNDFAEIYIADNHQCIAKIEALIKEMQIT